MASPSQLSPLGSPRLRAPTEQACEALVISRAVRIPDPPRILRALRVPELGPRCLFFSGGTALKETSRRLTQYTHHSIHIVTPFDSGGSSASLRKAFQIPAVGDIRNRLLALADKSDHRSSRLYELLNLRLAGPAPEAVLDAIAMGSHPMIKSVGPPMCDLVQVHLQLVREALPPEFPLAGASVGNLVLVGGFLANQKNLDATIFLFSKLLEVRGLVRAGCNRHLHLAARLASGQRIVGQHLITAGSASRLESIELCNPDGSGLEASVAASDSVCDLILSAELIVYPMGSFFTSVLPNLIIDGISSGIARNRCPKIYIPNTYPDPECQGWSLAELVGCLVGCMREKCCPPASCTALLTHVILDTDPELYGGESAVLECAAAAEAMGVEMVYTTLVTPESSPRVDPVKLVEVIISICG